LSKELPKAGYLKCMLESDAATFFDNWKTFAALNIDTYEKQWVIIKINEAKDRLCDVPPLYCSFPSDSIPS
jgi:hypothetical protein